MIDILKELKDAFPEHQFELIESKEDVSNLPLFSLKIDGEEARVRWPTMSEIEIEKLDPSTVMSLEQELIRQVILSVKKVIELKEEKRKNEKI